MMCIASPWPLNNPAGHNISKSMVDAEPCQTTRPGLDEKNAAFSTFLKQSANITLSYMENS